MCCERRRGIGAPVRVLLLVAAQSVHERSHIRGGTHPTGDRPAGALPRGVHLVGFGECRVELAHEHERDDHAAGREEHDRAADFVASHELCDLARPPQVTGSDRRLHRHVIRVGDLHAGARVAMVHAIDELETVERVLRRLANRSARKCRHGEAVQCIAQQHRIVEGASRPDRACREDSVSGRLWSGSTPRLGSQKRRAGDRISRGREVVRAAQNRFGFLERDRLGELA